MSILSDNSFLVSLSGFCLKTKYKISALAFLHSVSNSNCKSDYSMTRNFKILSFKNNLRFSEKQNMRSSLFLSFAILLLIPGIFARGRIRVGGRRTSVIRRPVSQQSRVFSSHPRITYTHQTNYVPTYRLPPKPSYESNHYGLLPEYRIPNTTPTTTSKPKIEYVGDGGLFNVIFFFGLITISSSYQRTIRCFAKTSFSKYESHYSYE